MKKLLVATLIFLIALPCAFADWQTWKSGQNGQAAGYQFTVPKGWVGVDQDSFVVFLPPEDPKRGTILLMPVELPSGDLEKQALLALKNYAMGMVNTPPQISKPLHERLENGMEYVSAYTNYNDEKLGDVFLAVFAREQNGAVGMMLFEAQKKEAQSLAPDAIHLFAYLDLTDEAKALAAARARRGNPGKSQ
jgi:hypothetical protein